jgi:PKHD-type hydroxylase
MTMQLDPHYWAFPSAIPKDVCDLIVKEGNTLSFEDAQAGGRVNPKVRKSRVGWFSRDTWVQSLMMYYITTANSQAWNFIVSGVENIQFTHYGLNEFYEAHIDAFTLTDGMRKVSAVLQLCDPETYEGGRLKLQNTYSGEFFEPPEFSTQGSIIVFPSFLLHQVTPVTKGDRYSAVAWATGPQFR